MQSISDSPTKRRAMLLREHCDIQSGRGLEFGPLANPIVKKAEGNVFYLDHLTTSGLQEKYANDASINKENIVGIDFVLSDGLQVLNGQPGYDYVIASHVFEHIANPLDWLWQLENYLNEGATVALAIPDKRHTFDVLRQETRFSELLACAELRIERPTPLQVLDHFLNVAVVSTKDTWSIDFRSDLLSKKYNYNTALDAARRSKSMYVDCHCTVWTSDSFLSCWDLLVSSELVNNYKLIQIYEPIVNGNDFIAILRKIKDSKRA